MSNLSFGSFTSVVLYLGYSALLSFLFFVLTGKQMSPLIAVGSYTDSTRRDNRLLLELGVCSPNLRINQDRLGLLSVAWLYIRWSSVIHGDYGQDFLSRFHSDNMLIL